MHTRRKKNKLQRRLFWVQMISITLNLRAFDICALTNIYEPLTRVHSQTLRFACANKKYCEEQKCSGPTLAPQTLVGSEGGNQGRSKVRSLGPDTARTR